MTVEELKKKLNLTPKQRLQSVSGREAEIVGITKEHVLAIEIGTNKRIAIPLKYILPENPFQGQENPVGN